MITITDVTITASLADNTTGETEQAFLTSFTDLQFRFNFVFVSISV